ncbi:Succinylglutamate desuccinylase/aspartoacylase [Candidatus Sulfopaludibacter sp. SbA4]|nr:Succinylglutamate desuccinylase/aspartoacylase [Candidatus Sulfopaludibacter sp. SbA4]
MAGGKPAGVTMESMKTWLVLVIACGMASGADLTVGSATAASGRKATGFIQVPAGVDAAANIPVIVVNGAKPGPTLALVAGSHGTEYASILALQKLAQSADPGELSGALIVVPLVNLASFAQKVPHLNPVDGKNMNRFFPGKPDGTQTERAAWAIAKQVVEKCDYLIDLHGGDLDEDLRQYAYWANTGKAALDAASRAMVLAFGLDHIIIQDYRTPLAAGATMNLTRFALSLGKASVTAEAGHAGMSSAEDLDALIEGCRNVMRHLKMLPGKAAPVEHPLWFGRVSILASEQDGVFYPLAAPESYVKHGMRIGYVTDYFGNRVWDAVAPISGVILYIGAVPSMKKGDTVAHIGEVAEAPM